jgi:CHAT domain-containing protein
MSERARARNLLDSLLESRPGIREGVDPELLNRELELRRRLNALEAYRDRLLARKHTAEQAAAVEKEVHDILTEYQGLRAKIRLASPGYAALTEPEPLGPKEIQQQVLDEDTTLLEYALGPERSFLWAVTRNTISCFELPGREQIEKLTRRVHELMVLSRTRQHRRESERGVEELSRMLLGPVSDRLKSKRLVIVADGALQYVPFAALTAKETKPPGARPAPLIVDHEVVHLPSASVLAVLRRETASRRPAEKAVAVLADPVFEVHDERLKSASIGAGNPAPEDRATSTSESGFGRFERLTFTRKEADAIFATAGRKNCLGALDFDASRKTATDPRLALYRMVHFATHGLINSRHPDLSGLVLSLVDRHGRPDDGFLRLHHIYNLNLNADLVVLSGCRTALGKEIRGEGLVRGFMYAGVPRVVASLWDVRDEATAELMKRFYRGMIADGKRAAEALRAAQLEMLRYERWRAPYYWAGFTLQGEWK